MSLRIKNTETIALRIQAAFKGVYESANYKKQLGEKIKGDNTPITKLDLEVNEILRVAIQSDADLKDINFFSEEDHTELKFPAAIIDPIDGTRGLAVGLPESVVSIAICSSGDLDQEHFAWIYNPFNGFSLHSDSPFIAAPNCFKEKKLLGLISRSDDEKGIYDHLKDHERVQLRPIGSIAYKLGLLAAGGGDFVISKTPKHIWDIAAGTHLCYERGIKLFNKSGEVKALSEKRIQGPLLWAHTDRYQELKFLLED